MYPVKKAHNTVVIDARIKCLKPIDVPLMKGGPVQVNRHRYRTDDKYKNMDFSFGDLDKMALACKELYDYRDNGIPK